MFKQKLRVALAVIAASLSVPATAAALTEMETRWLKAAGPVLAYSQRIKLPIDIIVQPLARANDVPMAIGFQDGRCKLVLSMRGNPDAEKVLDNTPVALRTVLMEAMAAHEIGHCWRYAQGAWHALPHGFVDAGAQDADSAELVAESRQLRENRREEGFADLVALAWTKRHHPASYDQVYAWLAALRAHPPVAGSSHDTRAWVRLARDASIFKQGATPFDDAGAAWSEGLLNAE